MAARIRKGDTVLVITGVEQGRPRRGAAGVPARRSRAGAGRQRRHAATKPTPHGSAARRHLEREASIHLSNLMLIDPKSEKPTKVGFRVLDDGRKVRVAKATGEVIES